MVFIPGQSATSGQPTLASQMSTSFANGDYLQSKGNVEHWFDATTGDGLHKAITAVSKNAAGATVVDILTMEWNPVGGGALDDHGLGMVTILDNDAEERIEFWRFDIKAADVSDGAEDTELSMKAHVAGVNTDILSFSSGAWDFEGLNIINVGNLVAGGGTWDDPWILGGVMWIWVHDIPAGNQWLMFKTSAPVGANQNAVKDDATGFYAQSAAAVPDA